MPILTQPIQNTGPTADAVAIQLKRQAQQTYTQLLNTFERGIRQIWTNPRFTPAELLQALGTDAVELFQLHGALGAFLEAQKPGCTAEVVPLIQAYTTHEDGTITLN